MTTITEFVNKYYDIVFKGSRVDKNNIESVDEFLLADRHDSYGHAAINSLFINSFAQSKDCVLIEGRLSMKEIQPLDAKESAWLTTEVPIFGWDFADFGAENRKVDQLNCRIWVLIKKIASSDSKDEKEVLKLELYDALSKYFQILISLGPDVSEAELIKTFPTRTQAMIHSLSKASEFSNRRFLIAGRAHLDLNCDDTRFREFLPDFFDFLRLRKAIVLVPKDAEVQTRGQVMEEIFCEMILKLKSEGFMDETMPSSSSFSTDASTYVSSKSPDYF